MWFSLFVIEWVSFNLWSFQSQCNVMRDTTLFLCPRAGVSNSVAPSAHPSYSHYYLLSPSTLFFFLHILLFFAHLIVFCTSYCFLHILLFCTFLFHCTFYSYFSFFTIYMPLCCVTLYNFYFYYFALSTERTWFDYISLLIIPCIIYYVTNKETLTLPCQGPAVFRCNPN